MKIANLNNEDKHREKAMQNGISSLTDSELLALLISTGHKGESSLEIASKLFFQYPNLDKLKNISYQELTSFKGLGKARSLTLLASFELARRIELKKSPEYSYEDVLKRIKGNIYVEEFHLLCLDSSKTLIRDYSFSSFRFDKIDIDINSLTKIALRCDGKKVCLVHTHLSKFPYPSKEDVNTSLLLKDKFAQFDIEFFDSIILTKENMYSFKKEGLL